MTRMVVVEVLRDGIICAWHDRHDCYVTQKIPAWVLVQLPKEMA